MKNKLLKTFVFVLGIFLSAGLFAGCFETTTQSNVKYWFSDYTTNFVKYNDETNNIDEAGNYWNFTVKNDCNIAITILAQNKGTSSSGIDRVPLIKFTKNGEQIPGVSSVGNSMKYTDLNLQKGDKLVFHAFWINSLETTPEGFSIYMFTINDGTSEYSITDINK